MKLKIIIIILGFLVLISTSELLYNFNNNDNFRLGSFLYLARLSAKTQNLELSFKYLGKAAEIRFSETIKKYPDIEFEELPASPSLPESRNLQSQYLDLLGNIDYKLLFSSDPKYLSKIFYTLGLLAYWNNEPELTESFWKSAVNFAPQWSYFHIELANYYLLSGHKSKAEEQLNKCTYLEDPKLHCQQYKESNFNSELVEEAGFLKDEIEKNI